jgi:hypothetical protein
MLSSTGILPGDRRHHRKNLRSEIARLIDYCKK